LVARLTPYLRVYTTEAAGLLRLARRTFLAGLLPSAAVYVGFCMGMGALVGQPALRAAADVSGRLGVGPAAAAGLAPPAAVAPAAIDSSIASESPSTREGRKNASDARRISILVRSSFTSPVKITRGSAKRRSSWRRMRPSPTTTIFRQAGGSAAQHAANSRP